MMVALWLFVGGAVGVLNALVLWWAVGYIRPDAPGHALVGGVLVVALQQGIAPGLLAFTGLWIARWGMVRWLGFRAA